MISDVCGREWAQGCSPRPTPTFATTRRSAKSGGGQPASSGGPPHRGELVILHADVRASRREHDGTHGEDRRVTRRSTLGCPRRPHGSTCDPAVRPVADRPGRRAPSGRAVGAERSRGGRSPLAHRDNRRSRHAHTRLGAALGRGRTPLDAAHRRTTRADTRGGSTGHARGGGAVHDRGVVRLYPGDRTDRARHADAGAAGIPPRLLLPAAGLGAPPRGHDTRVPPAQDDYQP